MREALVRQAAPQKSWPTTEMISTNLPQPVPSASTEQRRREAERFVGAVDVGDREGDREQHDPADHAPSRRSTSRPPSRADSEAPWVSSEMWAEASKPVIVYWVSRNPSGRT